MDPRHSFDRLRYALDARRELFDENHQAAFRLFTGFYEGSEAERDLAVDLYGRTLVIHTYQEAPDLLAPTYQPLLDFYLEHLPWLACAVLKPHKAQVREARKGILLLGTRPERKVKEAGVWYALDLLLHQDTTLYLDTRELRKWLRVNLQGKTLLNTFAYTGSLGEAARAGGAAEVIQTDLDRTFLNLAKETCSLNGFTVRRSDFISGNFFPITSRMRREGRSFDAVILDPPFFSQTPQGRVDVEMDMIRLINKVRPLINDGGFLIAVNNAVFIEGIAYIAALEELGADGYVQIEELIPIPQDITGYPQTRILPPLVDPSPFNHSTKIAVLRVKKKE